MVNGAGAGEAEPRPMAFARSHSEGLGLDGGRGGTPQNNKERSAHMGWRLMMREGLKPYGRDDRLGSRKPGPEGAQCRKGG